MKTVPLYTQKENLSFSRALGGLAEHKLQQMKDWAGFVGQSEAWWLRKKGICHAEPFAVTLSEAKGLQFVRLGQMREASVVPR